MMNLRLALVLALFLVLAGRASANHVKPLVIRTPNVVTKDVIFKVNTATDDSRLVKVCVYRTDINSPDVFTPVACLGVEFGRQPISAEIMHSNVGVVLEIPYNVGDMVPGQDQEFGVKNIASVDGVEFTSAYGNKGLIPHEVPEPIFIVKAPNAE